MVIKPHMGKPLGSSSDGSDQQALGSLCHSFKIHLGVNWFHNRKWQCEGAVREKIGSHGCLCIPSLSGKVDGSTSHG